MSALGTHFPSRLYSWYQVPEPVSGISNHLLELNKVMNLDLISLSSPTPLLFLGLKFHLLQELSAWRRTWAATILSVRRLGLMSSGKWLVRAGAEP